MKDFNKKAIHVRRMVEHANRHAAPTPTNYTRFHYMSETNDKGLFLFGVYDYLDKKHALVDVFSTNLEAHVKHMEEILNSSNE